MGIILLIIVLILLIGGLPVWGHSRQWGYRPFSILSVVLVVIMVLLLMGYIPRGF